MKTACLGHLFRSQFYQASVHTEQNFGFFPPVDLSHVTLIIRPAGSREGGEEFFLPYNTPPSKSTPPPRQRGPIFLQTRLHSTIPQALSWGTPLGILEQSSISRTVPRFPRATLAYLHSLHSLSPAHSDSDAHFTTGPSSENTPSSRDLGTTIHASYKPPTCVV